MSLEVNALRKYLGFAISITITLSIRHGKTDWNVKQLCQGQRDIPLNEEGRKQAQAAREHIKTLALKTIIYSPLKRASETAAILAESAPEAHMLALKDLMERAWGSYEGSACEKMYTYEQAERTVGVVLEDLGDGFETKSMFLSRIDAALNTVFEQDAPILVVSHGRFFNAMCDHLDIPPLKQLQNGVPLKVIEQTGSWEIQKVRD